MPRYPRSRTRFRVVGATVAILTLLVASTVIGVSFVMGDEREGATQHREVTQSPSPPTATQTGEPRTASEQPGMRNSEVDADIARLRAAPAAPAATTGSPLPRIAGDATQHPDLYAAEFARQLLTQDYSKARQAWLSWVQNESARTDEPLVVGLVPPELRDRWALFTVTDATDGAAPIPTSAEWAMLAQGNGRANARVQRVTEPMAWINAVEAGRITDPGITARIVSAEVTLTTVVDGQTRREVTSVELGLEFEGPPTRDAWGFVGAVTYNAIPLGPS